MLANRGALIRSAGHLSPQKALHSGTMLRFFPTSKYLLLVISGEQFQGSKVAQQEPASASLYEPPLGENAHLPRDRLPVCAD